MNQSVPKLRSPNFGFLAKHNSLLLQYAALAERYVFNDPNSCLIKLRQLAEGLAEASAAHAGIYLTEREDFADILQRLWQQRLLTPKVSQFFHGLRKAGNKAVHEGAGTRRESLFQLRMARNAAIWFHKTFGVDHRFSPGPFTPPPDPNDAGRELHDR